MSFSVALSRVTKREFLRMIKASQVLVKDAYLGEEQSVDLSMMSEDGKKLILPMGMLEELGYSPPARNPPRTKVESTKALYTTETDPKKYRDQDQVAEAILKRWEEKGVAFLAAATGFGKTTIGQYLTAHTKLKTAVVCQLDLVRKQWKDEYETFTNAKVQMISGKKPLDPDADVYIFGVTKAGTFDQESLKDIGLLIFDEAHLSAKQGMTKALLAFRPKYVLGLSATPHLSFGGGDLLDKAFGGDFIYRKETKEFTVIKLETDFVPKVETKLVLGKSRPDWVGVINSICYNPQRWGWIADTILRILEEDPDRRLLVLSQRTLQTQGIIAALKARGFEDVFWVVKKNTKGVQNYRVQIAGLKKAGAGYDDPSRNCGMLVDDMMNVEQYEGRIRAVGCFIYDLVDCFSTFEKHWDMRERWYRGKGATVIVEPRKNYVQKYSKKGKFSGGVPEKSLFARAGKRK